MRIITFLPGLLLFLIQCHTPTSEYNKLQGNALGTTFHITYSGKAVNPEQIDSLFKEINSVLSTYHNNSVISRFNHSRKGILITHPYFKEVYRKALRIYKETEGAFDPTIGVLVNAWQFGPEKSKKLPDSMRISQLLGYTGFSRLTWKGDSLLKKHPQTYLDFNAIAKGYAVDVIGRFLDAQKISDYMVEIGGEVKVRGNNPHQNDWTIGIEKPLTDGSRDIQLKIPVTDKSIATSGNYRKYRIDSTGRKYVHTINPKTGFPEINDLLSVTVISSLDCADTDAYATAFMVMGYGKAKSFILKYHDKLSAVLIYIDENGKIQTDKI